MLFLKQSTASQSVLIGPFVDSTDGATPETGLTIANTDIRLSANGGNLVAKNSGGGTHDEAGWYTITLDATDTATVGRLQLHCKVAGALMVHHEFQVLEEAVFDSLFGASAAGYQVPIWSSASATVNLSATTIATLNGHTPQTGDSYARLGAPAGASVSADVAAVKSDSAAILLDTGTDGVVVAAGSKTGYTLTATTGLGNQTANITGNLSGSVGSVTGAVGSVTGNVGGNVAGSVGSVTGNVGGNVTGSVGSLATQAKADVNAEVDTALSDAALATASALATVDGIVDDLKSGIIYGAAVTGTLSTTVATSNLSGYADDQLIGRVIIWLTGNCEGEASAITDYASLNGTITFDALTTAPVNTDLFKIV